MSGPVWERVRDHAEALDAEMVDLGDWDLKGLTDKTHIVQILPRALSERAKQWVPSEAQVAEERQSMAQALAALQAENAALQNKLAAMEAEVQRSMESAQGLLAEVSSAAVGSPEETLAHLKQELIDLVKTQHETNNQLHETRSHNAELERRAGEAQETMVMRFQAERAALLGEVDRLRQANAATEKRVVVERAPSMGHAVFLSIVGLCVVRIFATPFLSVNAPFFARN